MKMFLVLVAAASISVCQSQTRCYGISGKEALDLAVGIQQQAGENPAYAHVVPITELRPALILREV